MVNKMDCLKCAPIFLFSRAFAFYSFKTACAAFSTAILVSVLKNRHCFTHKLGDNALRCLDCMCFMSIYFYFLSDSNVVIVGSIDFFSLDNLNGALETEETLFFFFSSPYLFVAITPHVCLLVVVVVPHIKYKAEIYRPHLKKKEEIYVYMRKERERERDIGKGKE